MHMFKIDRPANDIGGRRNMLAYVYVLCDQLFYFGGSNTFCLDTMRLNVWASNK